MPQSSRRHRPLAACLLTALALCACATDRGERRGIVPECAVQDSPACLAAREGFQLVRYPTMTADRLVAAASRALGDLNFEPVRDDAQNRVSGSYIASAPTHAKQLDELFRKTLKSLDVTPESTAVSAQVEVLPLPGTDTGANVRLRLGVAAEAGATASIDSVGPYQIFFRQLGIELGAMPPPAQDDSQQKRNKPSLPPSISGV